MSTEPRPGFARTDILVVPLSDADGRPAALSEAHVIRAAPGPAPARPVPAAPSGPAVPAPDIRVPRPAPAPRPAVPDPVGPFEPVRSGYTVPSGPTYDEPAIDWRDITRTPTAAPVRTRAPGPAPVRTVLIVLGSAVGGTGAAGYIAGLVSSTVPFQILGWGAFGAGFLVLVVRVARAIGGRITGGGP